MQCDVHKWSISSQIDHKGELDLGPQFFCYKWGLKSQRMELTNPIKCPWAKNEKPAFVSLSKRLIVKDMNCDSKHACMLEL